MDIVEPLLERSRGAAQGVPGLSRIVSLPSRPRQTDTRILRDTQGDRRLNGSGQEERQNWNRYWPWPAPSVGCLPALRMSLISVEKPSRTGGKKKSSSRTMKM